MTSASHISPYATLLSCPALRVNAENDSRSVNTVLLTINKEDHTIGNLLRTKLLADERTIFAGYRMPHPLINHTLVRVRSFCLCSHNPASLPKFDAHHTSLPCLLS